MFGLLFKRLELELLQILCQSLSRELFLLLKFENVTLIFLLLFIIADFTLKELRSCNLRTILHCFTTLCRSGKQVFRLSVLSVFFVLSQMF